MPLPLLAALVPLIPFITPIIPKIAEWLGGDDAEEVARQVLPAITAVTGGSTDPVVVAQALADPSKAGELAVSLGRIAADREKVREDALTARLQAQLGDIANARATTVALAQAHSPMAYLAPAVCVFIFVMFGFVLVMEVLGYSTKLAEATRRLLDYLAIAAASYAIGSSVGSFAKDNRLAALDAATVRGTGSGAAPAASAPAEGTGIRPLVRR